jgi:Ni,Fe-hydrogenase III large subunit/NADH:ubiquinone oxidoreductase subunit C
MDTITHFQSNQTTPGVQTLELFNGLAEPLRSHLRAMFPSVVSGLSSSLPQAREAVLPVQPDDLHTLCMLLQGAGAHFADLFAEASAQPVDTSTPDLRLHLILAHDQARLWLHLVAPLTEPPHYPSLVNTLSAADWYERELWDEAGIVAKDHPRLRRLRLPATWPADTYPLRGMGGPHLLEASEAGAEEEGEAWVPLVGHDDEREVLDPGPEGVVDYPLGPVRSGVVESGHYTLRTVGEEIVDFHLQLFYKHRGIEQHAVGRSPLHLPLLAERISGTSGFAHALATCEALERAAEIVVPPRARFLRTFFAELERLYNHLGYHADLCQATGLVVGQAQFDLLKERVLRLNAELTGHRYLFGACVYGGVARNLSAEGVQAARALIGTLRQQAQRLGQMTLASPSHVDRLDHTGILPPEEARTWEVVGPIARASGIDRDARRDFPYAAYDEVTFDVPVLEQGDALARARVRVEEIIQSLRILEQILDKLPQGSVRLTDIELPKAQAALGWVESPRGEGLHWLQMDAGGHVARYRVRTASFANAQAFPLCIPGRNILTDFPVIEQSWGLSYAGADR